MSLPFLQQSTIGPCFELIETDNLTSYLWFILILSSNLRLSFLSGFFEIRSSLLLEHHGMKTYTGGKMKFYTLPASALDASERLNSGCLIPEERTQCLIEWEIRNRLTLGTRFWYHYHRTTDFISAYLQLTSLNSTLIKTILCYWLVQIFLDQISGSHGGEYEDDSLLGYSAW
jgi:hypothetical protein